MTVRSLLQSFSRASLVLGLGTWAALVSAATVTVRDVRLSAGPDGTRVVFDLSAPVQPNVFHLDNPARVVVDFPNAGLDRTLATLPPGQGVVKALRAAPRENNGLRVVLDLSEATPSKHFTAAPEQSFGHRLVLDLASAAAGVQPAAQPEPPAVPRVTRSLPANADRDIVVAIDAGHGGQDPGAIGRRGTREKDVTLAIARRLKERIDREPGMRAVLTRDRDVFLPLRDRIDRARSHQADMFVSVHADAVHNRTVTGSSVYVLSARGASSEAAKWLADQENAADLVGGISLEGKDDVLKSVLLDLSQGASMSASIEAAHNVLHELDRIGNVRKREVQHAGFVVLKSPDIPSMLVETAFISNPDEEAKLKDPRHQQRLAEAIHKGVLAYFDRNPPPGTHFARLRSRGQLAQSSEPARATAGVSQ